MPDFLLEIGTEEVPDWMIVPALADLRTRFEAAFSAFGGSALVTDATPRRFVLEAKGVLERAPDVESLVAGPYLSAGSKAAEGFAHKQNTSIDRLTKIQDEKGERYVFHRLTKGQEAAEALAERLPEVIASIHFPRTMYWTGKSGVRFIRPIRWILALLDDRVVDFELADVRPGNMTRGHRVLGSQQPVQVTIATYRDVLRANFVILSSEERAERIAQALGTDVQKDDELLRTLVYLTEFPSVVRGTFDPAYLELPREILSTVMRHHQRYFSVLTDDGSLAPAFLAVTNTDGDPEGLIRRGNERVLRARFNDARFFWKVDQRRRLADRVDDLAKVTFHAKLGSYKEKTDRVVALAAEISSAVHEADASVVTSAAELSKCDLTTDMVKEFPELQGIVGGLYAKAQREGDGVATAIYDQYKPISMDDSIPRTTEGQIVSIADKLDTLRQCFRIGLIPTGSKDPFALRRAAQGVIKILFESRLAVNLVNFVRDQPALVDFLNERMAYYLREIRGYPYDEVNAVMKPEETWLANLLDRLEGLHEIRATPDFEPLAASSKRIKNILEQAGNEQHPAPVSELLAPGPERNLYDAMNCVRTNLPHMTQYKDKLAAIASLRPHVDLFFDKILVNDPNPDIRRNRLALLDSLLTEFSTIADFSEIVTQGTGS